MHSTTPPTITVSNPNPHYGEQVTLTTHGVPKSLLSKGTFLVALYIYQGSCVMVSEVYGAAKQVKNPDGTYDCTSLPILLAGMGVGPSGGPSPYPNLPGYHGGDATATTTSYTDKNSMHTVVANAIFGVSP